MQELFHSYLCLPMGTVSPKDTTPSTSLSTMLSFLILSPVHGQELGEPYISFVFVGETESLGFSESPLEKNTAEMQKMAP